MIVTSVHDVVADRFLGFQLVDNEQVAIRGFRNALQQAYDDREGLYFTNPADFDLYYLGLFDEVTGSFTDLDHPRILYRGSSFVSKVHDDNETI